MANVHNVSTLGSSNGNAKSTVSVSSRFVSVRATAVREETTGVFVLEIPARELSQIEQEVLAGLFPHCEAQVEALLDVEALLANTVGGKR